MFGLVKIPITFKVFIDLDDMLKTARQAGVPDPIPDGSPCSGLVCPEVVNGKILVYLAGQRGKEDNNLALVHETVHAVSTATRYAGIDWTLDEETTAYMFESVYAELRKQALKLGVDL